ncbi:MAG: GTP 3',8-cyclase MoaA [Clostridiales bacterium]|nr:GTP 3',8-cyclase MoaA [Clostridiales bacterium]
MRDQYGREIDYLRVSLTDRCNLRCGYCLGSGPVRWLPEETLLTDEELCTVVSAAAELGISRLKLTGGEPLLRPGLPELVGRLYEIPGIEDITLTTNGLLLSAQAEQLAEAGVSGVNISLDTLNRASYAALTGTDGLERVLEGLDAALCAGFSHVKVNCVAGEGITDRNPAEVAELARTRRVWVRYIETMPLGRGKSYRPVTRTALIQELEERYGPLTPVDVRGNGPAIYCAVPDFAGLVGFISPCSAPFCDGCNRLRLTADGWLKPCLQYQGTVNLRELLRAGASGEMLKAALSAAIRSKPKGHRFAEDQAQTGLERRGMSAIGG